MRHRRSAIRVLAVLAVLALAGACAGRTETRCAPPRAHAGGEAEDDGHAHHGHGDDGHAHHGHGDDGHAHHGHGDERPHDPSQHQPHGGMQHDFSDVGRFEAVFDAPERAAWQRPVEVVRLLGAAPGETVVDLGAGTGYFLPYLSAAVGADGRVLALDTERAMVGHVEQRAEREGLANVEARVVAPDDAGLSPASVDGVLVVNTWHHLEDRGRYAARLAEALRPGGVVLVVDFTRESPQGPAVEHRIAPERVAQELAAAGLTAEVVREEGLPDQYVVRGTRR